MEVSRGQIVRLLAASAGFVGVGLAMLVLGHGLAVRLVGGAVVLFFGLGLVVSGWMLAAPQSYARLTGVRVASPPGARRARRPGPSSDTPFPIEAVDAEQALAVWGRMRDEGGGTPVILGDDAALEGHRQQWRADRRSPQSILRLAAGLSADAFRAAWTDQEDDERLPTGRWPAAAPPEASFDAAELVRDPSPTGQPARLHIARLPVAESAAAPAFLKFGSVNARPSPEQHVALLRQWAELYGAEVVACTADRLILHVARPPMRRQDALALARLAYDYADFDVANYAELAADLQTAHWWRFWWD